MFRYRHSLALLPLALGLAFAHAAQAAQPDSAAICPADAGWNDPAKPLHLYGNTWYVGTCGVSAILITSEQGHVLIDGATKKAAPMILANIRALGFKPEQVRYLLNSHEHHDHAGGLAHLQRVTGATVVAREPAATTLERGKSDRSDPQFLIADPFEPVTGSQRIAPGEALTVGSLVVTAHATPGHTPGGTSWTWNSCEADLCQQVAYVDSLTPISDDEYRFTDETAHPGVLAAYRHTLETVTDLPCDLLLTPHPGASRMWQRIGRGASEPLIAASACVDYAARAKTNLEQRITQENAGAP